MRKLLLLLLTLTLVLSCKSAPDADTSSDSDDNKNETNQNSDLTPNPTSGSDKSNSIDKIANRKDVANPKISQDIIAFYAPTQDLDYGIMYYAIETPSASSAHIPLGEFNDTIPQFEQTTRDSGLFLFQTSRRVFSYQHNDEVFVIDFQQGVVTREIDGVERYLLQIQRANGRTDFTQWSTEDADIKALNLQLKKQGLEEVKQGQTIKVHFIIRSSSTSHAQMHYISNAGTFTYTIK